MLLEPGDLPAAVRDHELVATMVAGANARAERVAPCLLEPGKETERAEARLILIGAVQRWAEAGAGAVQSTTAGPFGMTVDTRQRTGFNLWPSEIEVLQQLCAGDTGGVFTVDTMPSLPPPTVTRSSRAGDLRPRREFFPPSWPGGPRRPGSASQRRGVAIHVRRGTPHPPTRTQPGVGPFHTQHDHRRGGARLPTGPKEAPTPCCPYPPECCDAGCGCVCAGGRVPRCPWWLPHGLRVRGAYGFGVFGGCPSFTHRKPVSLSGMFGTRWTRGG